MSEEGYIEVIYGPMFSGKSSELLRKVRRFQHAKKKCLVVNYIHDNRYSAEDVMATHDRYPILNPGKPPKLSRPPTSRKSKSGQCCMMLWPSTRGSSTPTSSISVRSWPIMGPS